MSSTYYTSLSGMIAASHGLQNTSNNIANMNSPGFKRNDVFYSSLGNGNGEEGLGSGVHISGNATNFGDGKLLPSNNLSDLAIDGRGFFIVRTKSGELLYTRSGQFDFNQDGILIDRNSGGIVQGYNTAGQLVPIHEKGPQKAEGKATHEIYVNGKFVLKEKVKDNNIPDPDPTASKNKYTNIEFSVDNVYDNQGKAHRVTLEFESNPYIGNGDAKTGNDDGSKWKLIRVKYDDVLIDCPIEQAIVFSNGVDQGADQDNSAIKLSLNGIQDIKINFGNFKSGDEQSVKLVNSLSNPEGSKITVFQNDGYGEGKQISYSFDENGQITYNYDNGQSRQGVHVGLARFDDVSHSLLQTKDNLFRAKNNNGLHIGRPNENGFGSIKPQQIEASNVDSTTEFANIVILQRMFQSCSQIMDIDKQLLEELESK